MKNYKRFTEKRSGENAIPLRNAICGVDLPRWALHEENANERFLYGDAVNRLAELEDKIKNGTLIELPCKVGDKVYCIYHFDGWFEDGDMEYEIIPEEVVDIIIKKEDFYIETDCRMIGKFQRVCVCLTKSEAEKKLGELKGER